MLNKIILIDDVLYENGEETPSLIPVVVVAEDDEYAYCHIITSRTEKAIRTGYARKEFNLKIKYIRLKPLINCNLVDNMIGSINTTYCFRLRLSAIKDNRVIGRIFQELNDEIKIKWLFYQKEICEKDNAGLEDICKILNISTDLERTLKYQSFVRIMDNHPKETSFQKEYAKDIEDYFLGLKKEYAKLNTDRFHYDGTKFENKHVDSNTPFANIANHYIDIDE